MHAIKGDVKISFGSGQPQADTRARDILAQITNEQRAMYDTIYKPAQGRLQARLDNPNYVNGMASKALGYSNTAANNSVGISTRTQQRYGLKPTARQQTALNTSQALTKSTSGIDALNNTMRGAYGLKTAGLNVLTGLDASQAGGIRNNAGAMARLESGRNNKNQQIAAADAAGTGQLIGTAVGIGATFI